jgi:hypothetical protein
MRGAHHEKNGKKKKAGASLALWVRGALPTVGAWLWSLNTVGSFF